MAPLDVVLLWALLLVAFAYARGVSELQALSFDVGLGASESVWLHVIPDFVDGSVLAGVAPRSFVVPSLVFGLGSSCGQSSVPYSSVAVAYWALCWVASVPAEAFGTVSSATWVMWASFIVYVFLDSFRAVPGAIQRLTRSRPAW